MIFRGSFGHFYALVEFSMHLCAQFKFELHAHALMHINWLKIQICVLGFMLRSHARNRNEFQNHGTDDCRENIEMPGFQILVIQNSSEIHETCHATMERHQHAVVHILSHLGQVWEYASHKPELLTTSTMVSVGNVPPLGTKRYPLPVIAL